MDTSIFVGIVVILAMPFVIELFFELRDPSWPPPPPPRVSDAGKKEREV